MTIGQQGRTRTRDALQHLHTLVEQWFTHGHRCTPILQVLMLVSYGVAEQRTSQVVWGRLAGQHRSGGAGTFPKAQWMGDKPRCTASAYRP
jgi:hypothetical protein